MAMMTTVDKPQRGDETSSVMSNEASSILPSILPLILSTEDLLTFEEKKNLRLSCRAAKAAVDPYLTAVSIKHTRLSDRTELEAFRCSAVTRAAKHLKCGDCWNPFEKNLMIKISRIPFKNLQEACLRVDSRALYVIPLCKWKNLKSLELFVEWLHDLATLSEFNTAWKSFSKAKWPLLESLVLNIRVQKSTSYMNKSTDVDSGGSSGEESEDDPDPDIGGAACLLSYFPKLKNLKIKRRMLLEDIKAFAAVPHSTLESVELSFWCAGDCEQAAALAEAKWPCLQELSLRYKTYLLDLNANRNVVSNLVKAPWFSQLKKLVFLGNYNYFPLYAAQRLIQGLQFDIIQSLEIGDCSSDFLLAFENLELPKLKELFIHITEAEGQRSEALNKGFSCFFSTANLPCLEYLTVDYKDVYKPNIWNVPPACAEKMEADPFSILPSLKFLYLIGIAISKDCAKFVFNGFYKRGCKVDLWLVSIISGIDVERLVALLSSLKIPVSEFHQKLKDLGLYEKAMFFWLLSLEELIAIARSMRLS